jgi:hypothetical protein
MLSLPRFLSQLFAIVFDVLEQQRRKFAVFPPQTIVSATFADAAVFHDDNEVDVWQEG